MFLLSFVIGLFVVAPGIVAVVGMNYEALRWEPHQALFVVGVGIFVFGSPGFYDQRHWGKIADIVIGASSGVLTAGAAIWFLSWCGG